MKPFAVHNPNQTSGFTLIEVLVVVIIVGILAGIAAPGWLGFLNRQRVSTVRGDLMQTLRNAQQDAIQRRSSVPVVINTAAAVPTATVNGVALTLGEAGNPGNVQLQTWAGATKDTGFDTVIFDYRGAPTFRKGANNNTISNNPPFVININAGTSTAKQCVIVASLLGTLKTTSGAECDNPQLQ
jgi:prepilin-type N-terminal cleavage/methylation domain-containing protein